MTRICITGGPKTGKTTLATSLSYTAFTLDPNDASKLPTVRHTDDLIQSHDWSAASAEVASWLDAPGPWIIEGVAVSRALRKWRDQHPGEPPPCDRVIFLSEPYERLTPGQLTMAKGVGTVHHEIDTWLMAHGIYTETPHMTAPQKPRSSMYET